MLKKLFIIATILLFSTSAFAAWSVLTVEYERSFESSDGAKLILFKVSGTSDGGSSGDLKLSTGLNTAHGSEGGKFYWEEMKGGFFQALEFVAGSVTPTSQATITVDTGNGTLIFSETVAVAGTSEMFDGRADSDFLVPLTDLIFASTTLGASKTATFYIWILK